MKPFAYMLFITFSTSCGEVMVKEMPLDGGACAPELEEAICSRLDKNCGELLAVDNCGNRRVVSCGVCTGEESCGGSGEANVCGEGECIPTSCVAEGADCGTISDGCAGVLACGGCDGYDTCGGAGEDNVCGCTPITCAATGKDCGLIPDHCGDTIHCGTCSGDDVCGASEPNVCGEGECVPTTCEVENKDCDLISDGCGELLDCGSCSGFESCGGGGEPNVCGCTPTTCAAEGKNCDTISNGCGVELLCGGCSGFESCGGGGEPNVCGCTPTTCAVEGKNCGAIPNGCGGSLSCGSCSGAASCGGDGEPNVCGCPPLVTVDPDAFVYESSFPLFQGRILAQSFVSPDAIELASVRLEGAYGPLGVGGHITLSLYADVGGEPNAGTLLAAKTFAINDTDFTPPQEVGGLIDFTAHDFDLSDSAISLAPQGHYWLLIEFDQDHAYIQVSDGDLDPYPAGEVRLLDEGEWLHYVTTDVSFEIRECL